MREQRTERLSFLSAIGFAQSDALLLNQLSENYMTKSLQTHGISLNAPLYSLSVEQFILLNQLMKEHFEAPQQEDREYVHGLRGIQRLFDVSHKTAQRYKDTFLAPAITQNGRKILVDKKLALELWAQHWEN